MHQNSLDIMKSFVERFLSEKKNENLKILDIGSKIVKGQQRFGSYKQFFNNPNWTYVGADIDSGDNVDVVLIEQYEWPFSDESFDIIITGQTLEHVEFPWLFVEEIYRLLKMDGICCIIAPAKIHEHRYPIDTYRYYSDGMRALAKWTDLEVLEVNRIKIDEKMEDTYLIAKKV